MKTRILLIDDDAPFRNMFTAILTQAGYGVREAANGAEGMACLNREAFDVVLTDIFMPEQDGIETILRIRQAFPLLPVIAISGGSVLGEAEDYLRVAERLGAAKVLLKPFSRDELLAAITEVCPFPQDTTRSRPDAP